MIIVLFLIAVAILIGGIIVYENEDEEFGEVIVTIAIIGIVAELIAIIALSVGISKLRVIDTKIEMYQEENTKIEEQISVAVKQYQDYESNIFAEASPDSAITLIALYPELKSDVLVQQQIDVYLTNNEKIKELKEQKINGTIKRWWLYFGK